MFFYSNLLSFSKPHLKEKYHSLVSQDSYFATYVYIGVLARVLLSLEPDQQPALLEALEQSEQAAQEWISDKRELGPVITEQIERSILAVTR